MIGSIIGTQIGGGGSSVISTVPVMTVQLTDSADPTPAGAAFSYAVQVGNTSPVAATTVSCVVTLDASLTYVSSSGAGWSIGVAGQVVTCTRASLQLSTAPTITINVTAGNSAVTASSSVQVTAANATNVNATQTTAVVRPTWASTLIAPTAVQDSASYTYTAQVTNSGAGVVKNASITFTLDANTTWVSTTGAGWTLAHPSAHVVTATQVSLAVGAVTPIVITVTAPGSDTAMTSTLAGSADNAANLAGNSTNTSSVTITKDGPSSWIRPASLNEWIGATAGIDPSVVPPQFYFRLQEASGDITDDMQGAVMTASGAPTYQQALTGWTSKTINFTDGTANQGFGSGQGTLWSAASQSVAILGYLFVSASAARRMVIGIAGTTARVDILSNGKLQLTPAGGSPNGTVVYTDGVMHPVLILWQPGTASQLYDGGGTYIVATDKEKITGAWSDASGSGERSISAGGEGGAITAFGGGFNMLASWVGSAADAIITVGAKAFLQGLGITVTGY